MMYLYEGGNAIPDSQSVRREDVAKVVATAKGLMPPSLLKNAQTDIGSAGYKIESGDIDIMVDARDAIEAFKTSDEKDPIKSAKQQLAKYFTAKGLQAVVQGRNVSIGVNYETAGGEKRLAQVDVMVIEDAAIVAPWHQHGPRGMYDQPGFKGSSNFILMNSIAKFLGLKFDAFGAKLMRRDDNTVVGRTRNEVAKILLGNKAKESDLDSVSSMVKALQDDPDRDAKLAQAREDAAKGLITLPERAPAVGTAAWFRSLRENL